MVAELREDPLQQEGARPPSAERGTCLLLGGGRAQRKPKCQLHCQGGEGNFHGGKAARRERVPQNQVENGSVWVT